MPLRSAAREHRSPDQILAQSRTDCSNAIAAGQRLHMGVTLSYVGGSSDKFWSAVWVEDMVVVHFGGHGTQGQYKTHACATIEEAATKMWQLLREKVGKGYCVVDASVMRLRDDLRSASAPITNRLDFEYLAMRDWYDLRDARRLNPVRHTDGTEAEGLSPRSSKQGREVLLEATAAEADETTLIEASQAVESERFLPPLVLSRPDAPEVARFMAALGDRRVMVV